MASIRKRTKNDGSVSYRVDVRLKGYPPQRATFTRLTDARRWGQQTEAAIRENRYFKTSETRKHTLSDAIDKYITTALPGKKGQKRQIAKLDWWRNEIGSYSLSDITPALISDCCDKLLNGITKRGTVRSPATVVRYLAALSIVLSTAANEWQWIEDSPMRKVRKPTEPRGRVRFLSEDTISPTGETIRGERTRLLRACEDSTHPYLYPIVVLALSTGMRLGEIMSLTWDNVDLHQGRITLHETKNNERRVVPLSGKALEILKEHAKVRRLNTSLLFSSKTKPDRPAEIRKPWLAALEQAQIEDFRFHDLEAFSSILSGHEWRFTG